MPNFVSTCVRLAALCIEHGLRTATEAAVHLDEGTSTWRLFDGWATPSHLLILGGWVVGHRVPAAGGVVRLQIGRFALRTIRLGMPVSRLVLFCGGVAAHDVAASGGMGCHDWGSARVPEEDCLQNMPILSLQPDIMCIIG